jgi:hypothetical protein
MLMVGGGLPEARGHQQITRVATRLWDLGRSYLAEPRQILQVRDTALVLASHGTAQPGRPGPILRATGGPKLPPSNHLSDGALGDTDDPYGRRNRNAGDAGG